ncbi:hypothetical protein Tco_0255118 [Tanacetum coccineum]
MQKNLALIAKYFKKLYKPTNKNLRTSSNSINKNVDTTLRYKNDNQTGQFGNQRTVTVAGDRETVGSQEAKKAFDVEYNVFANEKQHFVQSESISNTCAVEKVDSNVIPDSSNMCDNDILTDPNAEECDDERVVLANLNVNLKLDIDENKRIQKKLKKANASLTHELKECKSTLAETSRTLGESNSIRDSCLIIPYDTSDPTNRFTPDREETLTLEKESRSKLNKDKVKPYDYTKLNSFYEIFKPALKEYHDQLAHVNGVRKKM